MCDDGDIFDLDHVDFQVKQAGTEEVTLENVEQGAIFRIKIILNLVSRTAKITFSWKFSNSLCNCKQLLQISEFQNCTGKPFNLRIKSKEYGIVIFEQKSEQGISIPPSLFYLEIWKALVILQEKINKPIMIPIRKFSKDEISSLNELKTIVRSGKITGTWREFTASPKGLSLEGYTALSDHPNNVYFSAEQVQNIFGLELPLGKVQTLFKNAMISNLQEVQEAYLKKTGEIEIHFVAQNGKAEVESIYADFYKEG
jgi:hypothetical protein